jgi:peptide/nickel transport system permease protein
VTDTRLAAVAADAEPPDESAPTALGKRRLGWAAWVCLGWIVIMGLVAIFCTVLPFSKHIQPNQAPYLLGPFQSSAHILGADGTGRDLLAITLYGTRASFIVGFLSIAGAFLIGGTFGLLAGYFRGRIETVFTSLFDIILAFPQLILALALVVFLRGSPLNPSGIPPTLIVVIALGIVGIPILARITRASTLTWSERDFVLAAKAQGATNARILFREVLPNVVPAMVSLATLSVAVAIVAEGALSILGVGVPPTTPSWGNIISAGQSQFTNGAPSIVLVPSVFMFITVFALNYLGDAVRERFDVRESAL